MKETLKVVNKMITKFLLKEGGMSNGYCTIIDGSLHYRNSFLVYSTPTSDDLTGRENKERASKLCEDIKKYLTKNKFYDNIAVKSTRDEHGCHNTYLTVKVEQRLNFNI